MVAIRSDASRHMQELTQSFVVVLRLEPSDADEDGRWRGSVRSVQTDRETPFSDLGALQRFLAEETGQEFPTEGRGASPPGKPLETPGT